MKARILREDFVNTISEAVRFVSNRAQLPVLNNIVFRVGAVSLSVAATNLEMAYVAKVGAKVDESGEIAVPAKTLSDLVASLDTDTIELESSGEILHISAEGFNSRLSGMNVADFPDVASELPGGAIEIDADTFTKAVKLTAFSVSSDTTRVVLTAILLTKNKKTVDFVSTDGFRLSRYSAESVDIPDARQILIPKSVMVEVARMVGKETKIKFAYDGTQNQVVFGVGSRVITSRVVSGSFPEYEKIIPETSTTELRVGKKELQAAIKTASVFARESANTIEFMVSDKGLKIISESMSGQQEIGVFGKVAGEGTQVLFNYRFVEDFLNVVAGEEIRIKLSGVKAAGIFTDVAEPDYLHLIMPVRG